MKNLNRIVAACRSLFRGARRPADAAALIAAAERELDVERMGHAEGIANRPAPDATDDANEARIGDHMRKIGADLRREHEQRLHDLMDRCAQLAAKFSPAFVTGLVDEAKDRLQALDARKRLELHEARRREREAQRELAVFRDANRLMRNARPSLFRSVPEGSAKIATKGRACATVKTSDKMTARPPAILTTPTAAPLLPPPPAAPPPCRRTACALPPECGQVPSRVALN